MIRSFYLRFPKVQTLSGILSGSHYIELLKVDDPMEMEFYAKQCEKEHWSVRELKRQRDSLLFHRLATATDKEGVLALAHKGQEITKAEDVIKDPYVLEFAGLPKKSIRRVNWRRHSTRVYRQVAIGRRNVVLSHIQTSHFGKCHLPNPGE